MEDEEVINVHDGVVSPEILKYDDDDFEARDISFDESENNFVIEDNYFTTHHYLPKKIEDIHWLNDLPYEELINTKDKIEQAVNIAKDSTKANMFNRLDGILLKKQSKQLILLSEFYLFDFELNKMNNYELTRTIEISTIDYITIGRSGNLLILHLVPIIKYQENINKNYVLNYSKLEKVVGCLTSSCFYDKPEGSTKKLDTINRHIPVITINDAFDIFDNLHKYTNFCDYRSLLNEFLESKIGYGELGEKISKFKYVSVKYRVKERAEVKKHKIGFTCGDLIIAKRFLWLVNYNKIKKQFDILYKIHIQNLVKMTINKYVANSFIIYDESVVTSGLEIISESYRSLLNLIDDLFQELTKLGVNK